MRFGLFGGARTDPGEQASDSRIYSDYIDYICEAEQLGFHSVFLVEHHFTGFGQVSATLNFLTYLAAKTTTMRLGTAVLVLPWHNPALLAEQAATLDLLSNGRFDFGVGKGYRWGEFHGFCIPMAEAEERYQETLAFLRKAWTSDGRFSHHGKYWHYEDVVIEPAPVHKPHPPMWIGAQSPNSIRYAAEQGYNLLLGQGGGPDTVAERRLDLSPCRRGAGSRVRYVHGRADPRAAHRDERKRARGGTGAPREVHGAGRGIVVVPDRRVADVGAAAQANDRRRAQRAHRARCAD